MTPLTFFLDWEVNCQFAGLVWARDRGLYARRGLEVRLVAPHENPGRTVLDLVLENELAAGCMEDNLIVRASLAGREVRAIGAMLQDTPMVLMTAADSGIAGLRDLPRRRIAMHRDGIHLLETILALHGIAAGDLNPTLEGWSLDDLVAGRFDAVQGYAITEPVLLARQGFAARLLPLRHADLDPYAQVMFATTRCIEERGPFLGDFLAATFEGWRAAMEGRDTASELVAAVSDEQPSVEENRAILDAMVPLVAGAVGLARVGDLEPDRWRRNLAAYARFGMVDRPAAVEEVIDRRFLPG